MKRLAKKIEEQLTNILDDFKLEVTKIVNEEVEIISKNLLRSLENDSPKKTGKYSKSWKSDKTINETNKKVITVYNKKGQLTHLLERGHLTKDGKSRTKAYPHIAKNEEEAKKIFIEHITKRIGR